MCTYIASNGSECSRANVNGTNYCPVHYGWDLTADEVKSLPENVEFRSMFAGLLANREGDWQGFVFSAGTTFPDSIDFHVVARDCRFESLDLTKTAFQQDADFSGSRFSGTSELRGVSFDGACNFERCRFDGPLSLLNVKCKGPANFYRTEFSERTIIRANFFSSANFNQAVFRSTVSFAGWRNVSAGINSGAISHSSASFIAGASCKPPTLVRRLKTLILSGWKRTKQIVRRTQSAIRAFGNKTDSWIRQFLRRFATRDPNTTIYRVFEGDCHFQDVIFMQPDHASFSQLDMFNAYVRGTNFSSVRFLGVNWWQPKLRRNGLKDELSIRMSPDGPFRYAELPALEETCRNVRVALEGGRSFNLASDFYIAEMEAARARMALVQRLVFSVPALYLATSKYGTSVGRALRIFLELVVLYVGLTLLIQGHIEPWKESGNAALQALQLLVFQAEPNASGQPAQMWIDATFRILGLIQLTMLVFSFRARIRRS